VLCKAVGWVHSSIPLASKMVEYLGDKTGAWTTSITYDSSAITPENGRAPPPKLKSTLSVQLGRQIAKPFWIDTVGRSNLVEIRIQLDDAVMRIFAQRSAAYASNSEIFLFWMVGTSSILLIVSVLFLRNQIKPILRLADAAESFGKGRDAPNFRPRGAREVRRAAQAFLEMKARIERSIEQRTAMLAGVSHDLRTVLTRFKLELALIRKKTPEVEAMQKDVDEMARMVEDTLRMRAMRETMVARVTAHASTTPAATRPAETVTDPGRGRSTSAAPRWCPRRSRAPSGRGRSG